MPKNKRRDFWWKASPYFVIPAIALLLMVVSAVVSILIKGRFSPMSFLITYLVVIFITYVGYTAWITSGK